MAVPTQIADSVAEAPGRPAGYRAKGNEFSERASRLRARAHLLIHLEAAFVAFLLAAIAGVLPLVMVLRG
jgi:hypothetical protein